MGIESESKRFNIFAYVKFESKIKVEKILKIDSASSIEEIAKDPKVKELIKERIRQLKSEGKYVESVYVRRGSSIKREPVNISKEVEEEIER